MTKSAIFKLSVFPLTLALLSPVSSAEAVSVYKITNLGILSPGTTDTRATGINNLGQVVGRETGTDTASHGFIWEHGTIKQLPELSYVDAVARSINDNGVIAGTIDPSSLGSDNEQAMMWRKNASGQYEGTYYGDYPNSLEKYFRDINNKNQVAGNFVYSKGATGVSEPLYWENSVTTLLPTLGGDVGSARALNDSTQLVGSVAISSTQRATTAVLWQKDNSGNFTLQNLGTFGGVQSAAININNAGQIVGQYSPVTGQTIPFRWQNGIKTDLGSLGGSAGNALSINSSGVVVGTSNTANNVSHAFIWEDNQIFDLNSLLVNGSGWQLTQATAINDLGQIVGYGFYTDSNGQTTTRAFVAEGVPEPEVYTGGVFALASLGLIRSFRKKKK